MEIRHLNQKQLAERWQVSEASLERSRLATAKSRLLSRAKSMAFCSVRIVAASLCKPFLTAEGLYCAAGNA
jgi:hypothetical protein